MLIANCDRGRSLREGKEGRRERNTQKLNEHLPTNQFIAHLHSVDRRPRHFMKKSTDAAGKRTSLNSADHHHRETGVEEGTGDGTRPRSMLGRVPPNSGRRAVFPRGTYVTLLQDIIIHPLFSYMSGPTVLRRK